MTGANGNDPSGTHSDYDSFAPAWQIVRDCLKGSRQIKSQGELYLPRLYKQTTADYEAYLKRANFFNACKRTLQALVGFVFRNNPEQIVPAAMAAFLRDATMTGRSFYDVEKDTVGEVLSVGRRGILVDWQLIPENRAFILTYDTEDILNWRYGRVEGKTVLTMITFREMSAEWIPLDATDKPPSEYDNRRYEQYRICELIKDEAGKFYYQVTVKRRKATQAKRRANPITDQWHVISVDIPTRRAQPLSRIPFVACGPEINCVDPREVPLESIAEINVSHFRTSADLENALHIAGVPTPIAAGFDVESGETNTAGGTAENEFYLGTSKAWVTDKADAKAYFLSYNAQDASGLVTAMERKETQMAALGARILEKQGSGKGQEAFETVQLRQGADMSALMSATIACSQSLSDVLQWVWWWTDRTVEQPEDLDDTVKTELNTEFIEQIMDSAMLRELWSVYSGNGISYEVFFERLQKGGIIGSERTIEQERSDLENSPLNLPVDDDEETVEEKAAREKEEKAKASAA